jgi:hypothetical protein
MEKGEVVLHRDPAFWVPEDGGIDIAGGTCGSREGYRVTGRKSEWCSLDRLRSFEPMTSLEAVAISLSPIGIRIPLEKAEESQTVPCERLVLEFFSGLVFFLLMQLEIKDVCWYEPLDFRKAGHIAGSLT